MRRAVFSNPPPSSRQSDLALRYQELSIRANRDHSPQPTRWLTNTYVATISRICADWQHRCRCRRRRRREEHQRGPDPGFKDASRIESNGSMNRQLTDFLHNCRTPSRLLRSRRREPSASSLTGALTSMRMCPSRLWLLPSCMNFQGRGGCEMEERAAGTLGMD